MPANARSRKQLAVAHYQRYKADVVTGHDVVAWKCGSTTAKEGLGYEGQLRLHRLML